MSVPVIKAEGLTKSYRLSKTNIVHALSGVDMTVERGEFTAIVGPSGGGKSTLLHILGLLDTPDGGRLMIDGQDASTLSVGQASKMRAQKIGFVFQGFNLLPSLTALENVMLAGRYGGMSRTARQQKATELLGNVGLGDRIKHRPNELSGGQQQRVALARALMNDPAVILADEPTGELDSATSLEIVNMLKALNERKNQTFLIVTHNDDVAAACKRIVHLKDGKNVS